MRRALRTAAAAVTADYGSPVEGDDSQERQLNIHVDPEHLAGVYSNFATVSFSDYEFTITFARIDHEVEDGEVPGVVVGRVNVAAVRTRAPRGAPGRVLQVHDGQGHPGPARDRPAHGLRGSKRK